MLESELFFCLDSLFLKMLSIYPSMHNDTETMGDQQPA